MHSLGTNCIFLTLKYLVSLIFFADGWRKTCVVRVKLVFTVVDYLALRLELSWRCQQYWVCLSQVREYALWTQTSPCRDTTSWPLFQFNSHHMSVKTWSDFVLSFVKCHIDTVWDVSSYLCIYFLNFSQSRDMYS